jgi:hypothetical protein
MLNLRVWFDGEEIDVSCHKMRMNLLEPEIAVPEKFHGRKIEVLLCCDTGYSQYAPDGNCGGGFYGKALLMAGCAAQGVEEASYRNGTVRFQAGGKKWEIEHKLMEA